MIFRIYHKTLGGHVHMRVFAGAHEGALGKCSDLIMRQEEFQHFCLIMPLEFEFHEDFDSLLRNN